MVTGILALLTAILVILRGEIIAMIPVKIKIMLFFTGTVHSYLYNADWTLRENYQNLEDGHLGSVSPMCYGYASSFDELQIPEFKTRVETINNKENTISTIQAENVRIREQYDSSLLEEIAGQPGELSINELRAREAKETLDENNARIQTLNGEINTLKEEILVLTPVEQFLNLLNSDDEFTNVENSFERASFWYPSIQIIFQVLFLAPLIAIATWLHIKADKDGNGQLALITWHLLVIFSIPLIVKIFQFLQVGALLSVFCGYSRRTVYWTTICFSLPLHLYNSLNNLCSD